jgi:inorganic phosphate transporter, PiT family
VLRPYQAVAWAAFFNFVAFAIFKTNVAATIGWWLTRLAA